MNAGRSARRQAASRSQLRTRLEGLTKTSAMNTAVLVGLCF